MKVILLIIISLIIYLTNINFNEIYNLAAQSHVKTSFDTPDYTFQVNTLGLLNLLEQCKKWQETKIYQASTSEMFGNSPSPQGIDTRFDPQSPYAISKLASHELIKHYREAYGIYAVSGILFNHESPRRPDKFVTRKIIKYFANAPSRFNKLKLGNIEAFRDWGFAPDYVKVMQGKSAIRRTKRLCTRYRWNYLCKRLFICFCKVCWVRLA